MTASLLLHLLVGAAAIGAISAPRGGTPPVIDLALADPAEDFPAGTIRPGAARSRTANIPGTVNRSAGTPSPVQALPAAPALPAADPAKDPGRVSVPEPPAPPVAPAIAKRPAASPPMDFFDPGASGRVRVAGIDGFSPAASAYPASPVVTAGSRQSVTPDARPGTAAEGRTATPGNPSGMTGAGRPAGDFAGIRDRIQRGIAYPAMARRMGWEGNVVVAFLVFPDGSVRNLRVVQGSGHDVLDRGAVDAVRNASPFPRSPAVTEIITPVVYRLSEAP